MFFIFAFIVLMIYMVEEFQKDAAKNSAQSHEIKKLRKSNENFQKSNENLKKSNENLQKSNENFKKSNENFQKSNEKLRKSNEKLQLEVFQKGEAMRKILRGFNRHY